MAPNAFDDLSRGRSEIQNPTQQLNFSDVSGGSRNIRELTSTISKMENINPNSEHLPNCHIDFGSEDSSTYKYNDNRSTAANSSFKPGDAATAPQQQGSSIGDTSNPQQGARPTDAATTPPSNDGSSAGKDPLIEQLSKQNPALGQVMADAQYYMSQPGYAAFSQLMSQNLAAGADGNSALQQSLTQFQQGGSSVPDVATLKSIVHADMPNLKTSAHTDGVAPQAVTDSSGTTPQQQGLKPSDASTTPQATPPTDASTTPQATQPTDASTTPQDQSWKSHANDSWVKDALTEHPDWHAMEGLHPGEVAVGNWEPTKEEKKVLSTAVDKMIAENNNGPVNVTLPDGSICTIEIVKDGQGQSFNKDHKPDDPTGKKHRKAKFGQAVQESDGPDCSSENSGDESCNANNAVSNPLTPSAVRVA